jgi:hypothetical protein
MLLAENYGKLPLHFEANQGQTDARVKFLSRGAGYTLFLTGTEAVFKLQRESAPEAQHKSTASPSSARDSDDAVLRMKLLAANPEAQVSGHQLVAEKSNYFLGNDPRQWRRDVANFSQVRYQDAYPGIDLVYYGNQQQLEYDFVVAPGADPGTITLDIGCDQKSGKGSSTAPLRIAANGDLLVPVGDGEVSFHRPVVYQGDRSAPRHSIGGSSHPIAETDAGQGRWVLKGPTQAGFEIAAYDTTRPLIIDPAIAYSTYLGGHGADVGQAVAVDSSGNDYVTGNTRSANFPTVNAVESAPAGQGDAFVAKLDPTGSTLLYSTYLGGSAFDSGFGIAVDSSGSAYVSGDTGSSDFPVTPGAFQSSWAGGTSDIFLTKLDPTGSSLVYSTFLGGTGTDRMVEGVAVDSLGEAFVTGWTTSANFPTTAGAFQTTFTGNEDGFVTKFNSSGSALVYSTLLGGNAQSIVNGIVLDSLNDAFVIGQTSATNFPTTPGVVQPKVAGRTDAFVTELNPAGSALLHSTYLGGGNSENGYGVSLDSSGNVYVSGLTCSSNFPTTAGAFQTVYKGTCALDGTGGNAFVAKLNPTLSSLLYSTYIGGAGSDVSYSIAVAGSGVAHLVGRTTSPNFPTTPGAFQTTFGGISDIFLTYLNSTGTGLIYSTYLGGNSSEAAYVLALDPSGNDIFAGRTHSNNFPTTPGVFDPTCRRCTLQTSASHVFVSKFVPGEQVWPMLLNFGNVTVGTTTAPQVTSLTNSESAALNIANIAIAGANASDFAESNTCGTSLAPGASCSVSVTLNPGATGARSGSLTITDSAPSSPQTVALSGAGTTSAASLTPSTINFPPQLVNTASPAQTVTLSSTGTTALTISQIAVAAPYSQTNNCTPSLAPGSNCTVRVTFRPTTQGTQKGTLTVTDNGAGSPQSMALTGAGTVISFSPTSLNFGNQIHGTSSTPQSITVTNVGSAAVSITGIAITGPQASSFSQTNNCGTSLGGGSACTIAVTFTPPSTGVSNGTVAVSDSGGGNQQTVRVSGTGT